MSDSKGFLWMTTENGLSRFDGMQFKNYQHNNTDSNSLQVNNVWDLAIDKQDRIYVTYKSGISVLDPAEGKFTRITLHGANILAETVNYDSATGIVFIFTPTGIVKYNTLTKKVTPGPVYKFPFKVLCWNLCKDNDGYLWAMLERRGYYRYSIQQDTGYYYESYDWPINLYQDKKGVYYMGTWASGFQVFDGIKNEHQKKVVQMPLSDLPGNNYIFCGIAEAPALTGTDILWVTTHVSGIGLYSKSQQKFIHHFAYNPRLKNGINSPYFWNIYTASDGSLWLCGWNGLLKVNAQNQYFQNAELPELHSGLYNCVTGIIDDPNKKNIAWMAVVGNGIAKYDKTTGRIIQRFYYNEQDVQTWYMERWPVSFFKDHNNVIWSSTYGGFIKINNEQVSYIPLTDSGEYCFADYAFMDSKGYLWQCGQKLFQFNPVTEKYVSWKIPHPENKKQGYPGVCEGSDGLIYVAAFSGVYSINTSTQALQKIFYTSSLPDSNEWKKPLAVTCIRQILYIATSNGLIGYNIQTKSARVIGAAEGLRQITRPPFYRDRLDRLWVYCATGLFLYDPDKNTLHHFTTSDGLYVNSADPAYFFEYGNETYLGSRMAYTKFNPIDVTVNSAIPVPFITSITVNNIPKDFPNSTQSLSISHKQNNISFDFTAIEYNFPERLSFSYQLEGYDKQWSTPGSNRRKSYTNLPAGTYTFRVKAFNNNGVPSAKTASYTFTIYPPIWQTVWFRLLAVCSFAVLLYVIYRLQIKRIKLQQEEKNKLQQVQLEHYKQQLEMEQIINFFSSSLADKNTQEEVIWDVAKNLIQKLGFANCMIYLWNEDKTELLQKAGYGPNGSLETVVKDPFNAKLWEGIVGHVAATKKPIMLGDTSKDPRYRADVLNRSSELCVPALYNGELVSVIDSEDFAKDYYTQTHLQILTTIATLMAARLVSIEAAEEARRKKEELAKMNEQLAQLELAALRSQMNPHFIFNSLNSIHKYIWENRQQDASEYLTKFSRLVRMILENSKEKEITLSDEIDMLHLYIELEHRRCNGRFNYSVEVDNSIDAANTSIPSMLIQPYVENAIWHGLVQKEGAGNLHIYFTENNHMLECTIEDDGIGREKAMEIKRSKQDKHTSLGLSITAKRVSLLYNESGEVATVQVFDKKHDTGKAAGTKVVLLLPLNNLY